MAQWLDRVLESPWKYLGGLSCFTGSE